MMAHFFSVKRQNLLGLPDLEAVKFAIYPG